MAGTSATPNGWTTSDILLNAPRFLIVGPAWVGDMVMAQALFRHLAGRYHGAVIDVLAPGWTFPLLSRMPEVRRAIEMPLGHGQLGLGVRRRLGRSLRSEGYDRAICLPITWKSALVPFHARIPRRSGFLGEQRWFLLNDIRSLKKAPATMAARYVWLGLERGEILTDPLPHPRLRVDAEARDATLARLGLSGEPPVLALCPGAEYGPAKRWPATHFAAVARQWLTERGGQVWIFGGEKDHEIGAAIVEEAPGVVNLAGRTSLTEAIDLLSLSEVVVSNDSGLMHVAAALDRPLVAVYGSSTPDYTPPLTQRAEIVSLGLSCSPCFRRECPQGHTRCLNELPPAWVWNALNTVRSPCRP